MFIAIDNRNTAFERQYLPKPGRFLSLKRFDKWAGSLNGTIALPYPPMRLGIVGNKINDADAGCQPLGIRARHRCSRLINIGYKIGAVKRAIAAPEFCAMFAII